MSEEYDTYTWIQRHMKMSERLYDIDQRGKQILNEIRAKKDLRLHKRRMALSKDFAKVYACVSETINMWRFKSRLFLSLLYYLDECMFENINESHEFFYIEDDRYELTKMYFGQEAWIRDQNVQRFSFLNNNSMNVEEALLMRGFFVNYEHTLRDIENLMKDVEGRPHFKRKIKQVLRRIRKRHAAAMAILDEVITADCVGSMEADG